MSLAASSRPRSPRFAASEPPIAPELSGNPSTILNSFCSLLSPRRDAQLLNLSPPRTATPSTPSRRLQTSGSPPLPRPLTPPTAPSQPLASPPCALGRADGARLRWAQTTPLHAQELAPALPRPGAAPGAPGSRRAGAPSGSRAVAALPRASAAVNFPRAGHSPAAPSASIPPVLPRRGHLCGIGLCLLSPGGCRTLRSGACSLCIKVPDGAGLGWLPHTAGTRALHLAAQS